MFQLTWDEVEEVLPGPNMQKDCLRSQSVTLNNRGRHRKHLPRVFTEQGAVMLASILNTDQSNGVTVSIVRAFVKLRNERVAEHRIFAEKLDQLRKEFDQKLSAQAQLLLEKTQNGSNYALPLRGSSYFMSPEEIATHPKFLHAEAIQKTVAKYYCLETRELLSHCRKKSIVLPRQIAMFLTLECTGWSFKEVGDYFKKDRTTVIHASQKITNEIAISSEFKRTLSDLRMSIERSLDKISG